MTTDDKAARLAAIRAANAAKKQSTANTALAAPNASAATKPTPPASEGAAKSPPKASPKPPSLPAEMPLDDLDVLAWPNAVLVLVSVVFGALLAVWAIPLLVPSLSDSLQGSQPHVYWLLSRSSGLVAYGLLWLSMVMGLLLSGRAAALWPGGPTALSIHQHTGLLGLAFGLFHALILLGDQYVGFGFADILLPLRSEYQPLWVVFGQLAWYGMAVVHGSFYVRRWIGRKAWRTIHYLSFGVFLLSLGHGILSGSDSGNMAIRWLYWITGASVLFLLFYRILASHKPAKAPQKADQMVRNGNS